LEASNPEAVVSENNHKEEIELIIDPMIVEAD
jgi:hypothetical protein